MCPICYKKDNEYTIKTWCGHKFHINCIVAWWWSTEYDNTCPMCRNVTSSDEYAYFVTLHTAFLYLRMAEKGDSYLKNWLRKVKLEIDGETKLENVLDAPEYLPTQAF